MKCKLGDMAVVIRSQAGNVGMVVTCMELLGSDVVIECGTYTFRLNGGPWWALDKGMNLNYNDEVIEGVFPFARDEVLMPIGNQKAPEEVKEREKDMA